VTDPIDDPAVGGVVVTARDVTAHRHLEEAPAAMKGANVDLPAGAGPGP
jgi:hypothetical protein